jgi:hypothetical protein
VKRYTRARPNKALPDQYKLVDKVKAQLTAEVRRRGQTLINYGAISFSMPIRLSDVVWSERQGRPYTPPNIERGLRRLIEAGASPELTVHFEFAQEGSGGSFRKQMQKEGVLPWRLEIDVYGFPSPMAADTINHELQHFVQWVGTGLIRLAEAPAGPLDLREVFRILPGHGGVYGVPRRDLRTYYGAEEGKTSGSTESTAIHAQYDVEFHTNVGSWASELISALSEAVLEPRRLTSDQLVEAVNQWFVQFAANTPRLKVDSKRMKRQKEQVFLTVSRRLGIPAALTEEVRRALGTTAPRREGFRKQKERRRKAREAGTLPVRPEADERGIRLGDWVTFNYAGLDVKGRVRGESSGRYIIEQAGDFYDPTPRARRKIVVAGSRWKMPKRSVQKIAPPPRAPRTQQPPTRPASTPTPRPRPTEPQAKEPIFAYLDRKLAALPRNRQKGTVTAIRVPLGLSNPQLLSWIFNAAAVSGADPQFTAEWPYDRDEPVDAPVPRRRGQTNLNIPRILFGTANYVGLVRTNLETRQTELWIKRPQDKKAPLAWTEVVYAVLREYGLQGNAVIG